MDNTLEKFGLKDPTDYRLKFGKFHIETMEGVPLADVPFGSLEIVLKCIFDCNECVVIHEKPAQL